tara:strand:- start:1543 stop:2088 length:546 start_codon:yes stop_codon:yes gene_type:complete
MIPALGSKLFVAQTAIAGASAYTKYKAAKNDAKAIEGHQRAVGESMLQQHASNMSDSLARQNEAQDKAARDRVQMQRQAMSVAATARTSALESGIGGGSYAALLNEFDQREAELTYASTLNQNLLSNRFRRERDQASQATQARMVSNYRPINQPSGVAAALDFAGDVGAAYASGKAAGTIS